MTSTTLKSFTYTHPSGKKYAVEFHEDIDYHSPLEDEGHGQVICMPINFDPSDADNVQEYIDERFTEHSQLEELARYSMLRELRPGGRFDDALFYDVWETRKIALSEGWGPGPEWDKANPNATPHERAAAAVETDYKYLRGYFDSEWHYVVLYVYALDEDGEKIETPHYACGGYESTIMDNETWLSEVVDDAILQIEYERKSIENPGQMSLRFT
jgi:hypothetical protein